MIRFNVPKWLLVTLAAGMLIPAALLWHVSFRDYRPRFVERKGSLTGIRVTPAGGDVRYEKAWLSLESVSGLRVECGMLTPRQKDRRFPAIVLLGGKATGKHAIDYALDIRDVIIVAVDYPFEPRESYSIPQILSDIPVLRRALLDMPPSVMLAMDYLHRRHDVDTTRIILLGYSFGAPLIPVVAANDRRAAAAALVYGGGDLYSLIRHNVRRYESAIVASTVAAAGALLLRPLEPLRSAPHVSPVPFLMINGTDDEQVPPENARLLFAAAKEPKTMIWIESGHVNPRDVDLTRRIIDTLKTELAKMRIIGF